jgi:mono/diheme cytochrome c family protein
MTKRIAIIQGRPENPATSGWHTPLRSAKKENRFMSSLLRSAIIALIPLLLTKPVSARESAQQSVKQYGDAKRGEAVVAMWCTGCHRSGPAADDRVPSLAALAANPARTDGVIRAFLMQPHKPMPPLELGTQQIEDIVAYLHSMRPATPLKR